MKRKPNWQRKLLTISLISVDHWMRHIIFMKGFIFWICIHLCVSLWAAELLQQKEYYMLLSPFMLLFCSLRIAIVPSVWKKSPASDTTWFKSNHICIVAWLFKNIKITLHKILFFFLIYWLNIFFLLLLAWLAFLLLPISSAALFGVKYAIRGTIITRFNNDLCSHEFVNLCEFYSRHNDPRFTPEELK